MFARVEFYGAVARMVNGHMWIDQAKVIDRPRFDPLTKGRHDVLVQLKAGGVQIPPEEIRMEVYDPFKRDAALFRILGGTPATKDAILGFANKYGLLFSDGNEIEFERDGRTRLTEGIPLLTWQENILGLRHWTTVWDFIQQDDWRGLDTYIRRMPALSQEEHQISGAGAIVERLIGPVFELYELRGKAQLAEAQRALTLAVWKSAACEGMTFYLKHDKNEGTIYPLLRTEHLATALWTQFALAIVEGKEYRQCKYCGKPFELAPDIARTNRDYCSHSCRLKAYRKRQKDAVVMHQKGKKLKHIAETLESDVPTVRGWITAAKEKKNESAGKKES